MFHVIEMGSFPNKLMKRKNGEQIIRIITLTLKFHLFACIHFQCSSSAKRK